MHMKYTFHNKFRMIIFHDQKTLLLNFKSNHSYMYFKIGVLKNFAIFTGKHLWWIYWTPGCGRKGPMNWGLSVCPSVRQFSWDWLISFF